MRLTINDKSFVRLEQELTKAGKVFNEKRLLGNMLRKSLKPMLETNIAEAPRGKGYERVSLRRRGPSANDYRRGGATKADQRIKIVDGKNGEIVRGLVGTDKSAGHSGWRTVFITLGTRFVRANDFIMRSYNRSFGTVKAFFLAESLAIVRKTLKK